MLRYDGTIFTFLTKDINLGTVSEANEISVTNAAGILSVNGGKNLTGGATGIVVLRKTGPGGFGTAHNNPGLSTIVGDTKVLAGTLRADNATNPNQFLGAATNRLFVGDPTGAANATFMFGNSASSFPNPITVVAGSAGKVQLGLNTTGTNLVWNSNISLEADVTLSGAMNYVPDGATVLTEGTTGQSIFAGKISSVGTVLITIKNGNTNVTQTTVLSNTTNDFTGNLHIVAGPSASTLQLNASGVIPDSSKVLVDAGQTFFVNGQTETIADVEGAGTISLTTGTLTVNPALGVTANFSGPITGNGVASIIKTGAGTQIMSGANSYSGTTVVNAGTLRGTGSNFSDHEQCHHFPGTAAAVANPSTYSDLGGDQIFLGSTADFEAASHLNAVITADSTGTVAHSTYLSVTGVATVQSGAALTIGVMTATYPTTDIPILLSTGAGFASPFNLTTPLPAGMTLVYRLDGNPIGQAAPDAGHLANQVVVHTTGGAVSPVTVDSFAVRAEGSGVLISWNCVSEYQNAGFNVYRRAVESSEWAKVNPALIAGRVTNPEAKMYSLYDWASAGRFEYKLESISIQGQAETYASLAGPISVDALMTASVGVSANGVDAVDAGINVDSAVLQTQTIASSFARLNQVTTLAAHGRFVQASASELSQRATVKTINMTARATAQTSEQIAAASTSSPVVGARWFSANVSSASNYSAAKIAYGAPGVMLIPQTMMPAGFDIGHVSMQREGRGFQALALTDAGAAGLCAGVQRRIHRQGRAVLPRLDGCNIGRTRDDGIGFVFQRDAGEHFISRRCDSRIPRRLF